MIFFFNQLSNIPRILQFCFSVLYPSVGKLPELWNWEVPCKHLHWFVEDCLQTWTLSGIYKFVSLSYAFLAAHAFAVHWPCGRHAVWRGADRQLVHRQRSLGQPGMAENILKTWAIRWTDGQTFLDQVFHFWKLKKKNYKQNIPSSYILKFYFNFLINWDPIYFGMEWFRGQVNVPCESLPLKQTSAFMIWSSCSKGISPHTMSKSRIPRDQTVAERPWYRWNRIHSGGLYTLVPESKNTKP